MPADHCPLSVVRCTLLTVALLIIGAVLPATVLAVTAGEKLQRDNAEFQETLEHDLGDSAADDAAYRADEGDELFPALETEAAVVEGDYVTFEWNGQRLAFTDVPVDSWFAPYVRDVAERRIVSGYSDAEGVPLGLFGPGNSVTVAELAKIALIAGGFATGNCPLPPANQTASNTWAAIFVSCAEAKQWSIYADGSIDTDRPALRQEVVATILEAFAVIVDEPLADRLFSDVDSSVLFRQSIETAAKDGIISGYADSSGVPTGLFGPNDPVLRSEIAKIVSLALLIYGQ